MAPSKLILLFFAPLTLSSCLFTGGGCTDTADPTFFRVFITNGVDPGSYEAELSWDGQSARCAWRGMPDLDTGGEEVWSFEADCTEGAPVAAWEQEGGVMISLEDQSPAAVQVRVGLDEEEVYADTLAPEYVVYGGERCGEDFQHREDITL